MYVCVAAKPHVWRFYWGKEGQHTVATDPPQELPTNPHISSARVSQSNHSSHSCSPRHGLLIKPLRYGTGGSRQPHIHTFSIMIRYTVPQHTAGGIYPQTPRHLRGHIGLPFVTASKQQGRGRGDDRHTAVHASGQVLPCTTSWSAC